jgi:hypothetical protein
MASKKTPLEKLDTAIQKLLEEYATDIKDESDKLAKKLAQKASATLKSTSPRSTMRASWGKKHYADQWSVKQEIGRLISETKVYNKAPTYRLTHLLEYGHAKKSGGRVPGKPHIKPVEETIIRDFEAGVKKAVKG